MITFIFDRDPELGAEPAGYFEKDGLHYVTVADPDDLECGVEPLDTLRYTCGCDATTTCEQCV